MASFTAQLSPGI
jgi:hypothetical protein